MKKILLLATVMMLFAAVGLMAQVSFSGDVRTRAAVEAEDQDAGMQDVRLRINLNANIDDYNSAAARFRHGTDDGATTAYFDRAHATTDLGAWLAGEMGVELPVGISYNIGLNEFTYADVADNSSYGFEALQNIDDFDPALGSKLSISVPDMANVYFAHQFTGDWGSEDKVYMLTGVDSSVDVGVGTVMVEAVYSAIGVEAADGNIGFAAVFSSDALVEGVNGYVGTSFTVLGDDDDDDFNYGVGAGVAYGNLVWADMSFAGGVGDVADDVKLLGLGLGSDPVDFLSVGSGLVVWLGEGDLNNDETLHNAELYLQLKPGAMTYTVGYYWLAEDAALDGADLETPETDYSNVYFTAEVSF